MRTLLAAFFATITREIAHHGGTVEKYIGDAVMAVFGLPVAARTPSALCAPRWTCRRPCATSTPSAGLRHRHRHQHRRCRRLRLRWRRARFCSRRSRRRRGCNPSPSRVPFSVGPRTHRASGLPCAAEYDYSRQVARAQGLGGAEMTAGSVVPAPRPDTTACARRWWRDVELEPTLDRVRSERQPRSSRSLARQVSEDPPRARVHPARVGRSGAALLEPDGTRCRMGPTPQIRSAPSAQPSCGRRSYGDGATPAGRHALSMARASPIGGAGGDAAQLLRLRRALDWPSCRMRGCCSPSPRRCAARASQMTQRASPRCWRTLSGWERC